MKNGFSKRNQNLYKQPGHVIPGMLPKSSDVRVWAQPKEQSPDVESAFHPPSTEEGM